MIGNITIRYPSEDTPLAEIVWRRKGSKKRGYLLSGLKVYEYKRPNKKLDLDVGLAVELLLNNLVRLQKINKLRSETDLKLYVNAFVEKHSRMMFEFNGSMEYNVVVKNDTTMKGMYRIFKQKASQSNASLRQLTSKELDRVQLRRMKDYQHRVGKHNG